MNGNSIMALLHSMQLGLGLDMNSNEANPVIENAVISTDCDVDDLDQDDNDDDGASQGEGSKTVFVQPANELKEQRAKRFGLDHQKWKLFAGKDLDHLYESFGIDDKERGTAERSGRYRLNSIHVRGVNNLSTDDILKYFKDFSPVSVEWINDFSCNVVWLDSVATAEAMLSLSKPIKRSDSPGNVKGIQEPSEFDTSKIHEEVVIITDEDDEMGEDESENPSPKEMEIVTKESSNVFEPSSPLGMDDDNEYVDINDIDIPVPPGIWRLGQQHIKAKTLLFRFATKADRKLPGAEKRSEYYLKYGNPNYGGMKGFISTSRKRKFRVEPFKNTTSKSSTPTKVYTERSEEEKDVSLSSSRHLDPTSGEEEEKPLKKIRMRMYADEEEKRSTKRLTSSSCGNSDLRRLLVNSKNTPEERRPKIHKDLRQHLQTNLRIVKHSDSSVKSNSPDLRTKLIRTSGRSPLLSSDKDDLRSKLDRLRKDKKMHSPLVIQVLQDDI